MGYYGITGWSGGGRRPINYGLKAGQFRTGKYNVFQNKTVINNNIFAGGYGGFNYGYYDQQCCGSGSSTPKWMNWMMGIGLGTSLLGGIFSLFGGEKTEGGGETPEAKPETDEFASAKTLYPDWRFAKEGDTYYAVKGETQLTGTSVNDLLGQIKNMGKDQEAAPAPKEKTTPEPKQKEQPTLTELENAYQQNADGYSPVKFDGANFANIFNNLTGVFDYGKDKNGNEIGDFANAKADLNGQTTFKEGSEITIGGKKYEILKSEDGFVYLKDAKSTRNGDQIYILEKTPSGGYQLSQRSFTDTTGFGKAAW